MAIRYTIKGGVSVPRTFSTVNRTARVLHDVQRVHVPLYTFGQVECLPQVGKGDRVLRGQCIGAPTADGGLLRFSPVSGTVESVSDRLCADGTHVPLVTVLNDGQETGVPPRHFAGKLKDAEPSALIGYIRDMGLVSRGEPLYARLERVDAQCKQLVVNCAESQNDRALMRYLCENAADQIINGAKILQKTLGISQAVIVINGEYREAVDALLDAIGESRLLRVAQVGSHHPQEDDISVLSAVGGITVGRAHREYNTVQFVIGGDECAAVFRTFVTGMPDTERTVAVSGDIVRESGYVRCPLGTPFSDLFRACGGLTQTAQTVVSGGLLSGRRVSADDFVEEDTVSLSALGTDQKKRDPLSAFFAKLTGTAAEDEEKRQCCIRCGACARVCPDDLLPHLMLRVAQTGKYKPIDNLSLSRCRLCGACSYVCPSHIPLSRIFAAEKSKGGAENREESK